MASTLILSDQSVSKSIEGKTSGVGKSKPWADLNLALTLHPVRKDIVPLKDDAALRNSIKNLLLTNFFERPFQPELGANLRGLLFEPADAITIMALRDNITSVITDYEPRVEIVFIDIKDKPDDNAYDITVKFRIKQYDKLDSVNIVLRRIR